MTTMRMRVIRVDTLTPAIRRLLLEPASATPLPPFTAGAHIVLHVPAHDRVLKRAYSLLNAPEETGRYEIAVRLEPASTGGSRWLHQIDVACEIDVDMPKNEFALNHEATKHLLIAGGIGITPILSMARALNHAGKRFTLHYAARDAASMAFREEVLSYGDAATCWFDGGDPMRGMPLQQVIGAPTVGHHLYVCGPKGLIAATLAQAAQLGWPPSQVHSELFSGALDPEGDAPFEVELAASGVSLTVPAGKSILEVMIDAGLDPIFDCRRGDCGVCTAQVLDGAADHRDICLSEQDRARGDFTPCVSRARSQRLVLDL
jgi:ferredoxin-NADP reductase